MSIVERLRNVMALTGAVAKGDKNQSQGWNFRGVDAVVNAVSPALREAGVVVVPYVEAHEVSTVQTSGGKPMQSAKVRVRYTFYGLDGDCIEAVSVGEAFDSGDKATAKAMSVALRTCLLQALMLPTNDPDPDHDVYQVEVSRFDPTDLDTWPDTLTQVEAKEVVLAHCKGDKAAAKAVWEQVSDWGAWPAHDLSNVLADNRKGRDV